MKDELDAKLYSLFQKGGIDLKIVETFLDNQNNFTDSQWEEVQTQREEYKKKLEELFGKKELEVQEKKVKKKKSGERNRKLLGDRKKWIPIR